MDFAMAVEATQTYLNTINARDNGMDLMVLDIDVTILSNVPYYIVNNYGWVFFGTFLLWDFFEL